MPEYVDQLGRAIQIKQSPKRIISLVPSQTELLSDLGLDDEVIGITKFCVHPQHWFRTKKRIGGTKQLHLEEIKQLRPDLIIANKEENVQEQIEQLAKDFPVWVSDVNNLDDALEMVALIGAVTTKQPIAKEIADRISGTFSELKTTNHKLQTCYLIWKEPFMTIGGDTFITDMMKRAGFQNVFEEFKRYPQITIEQLQAANCQILLLSSEPFPFKQKHAEELRQYLPDTKIILVDGEMFSWYGSRLLKAPAYFKQLQNQVLSLSHARGTE